MPDKDGKWTDGERAKILEWLRVKFPDESLKCPLCGWKEWVAANHMVIYPLLPANEAVPCVQFYCDRCSHIVAFNAAKMNVVDASPFEAVVEKDHG